jgi:GntR family transcriptional regulator, transcriptional repressor for pyruvate dehydrogenase complex
MPSLFNPVESRRLYQQIDLDRIFHVTLAETSGNAVLTRLVGELFDERHSPISAKISSRFESTRTWKAALKEHEARIVTAGRRRNEVSFAAVVCLRVARPPARGVSGPSPGCGACAPADWHA